jgi:hypothetical protein
MPKTYLNINDFSKGINNVKNRRDLSSGEAVEIVNFELSNRGELKPRGKFGELADGEALSFDGISTGVFTASVNPGYGLHYFEYDDETEVAGFSLTGISPSGDVLLGSGGNALGSDDGTSSNYYIGFLARSDTQPSTQLANPVSSWIAIGATTGLLTHANNNFLNDISSSSFPIKISVSGTSSNNGVFTVLGVVSGYHTGGGGGNFIANYGGDVITIKAGQAPLLMRIEENLAHEAIEAGTTVTFKRIGVQDDVALLLGNADDNKIDVFRASTSPVKTVDVIDMETIATSSTFPNWVFYSANGATRVADGNRLNASKPKWYGYIKRDMFFAAESGATSNIDSFISHSVESNLYAENNDLAKPTGGAYIASGSIDGSVEFAKADGSGWSISVAESTDSGLWEAKTYEFASTFIYDGNQESLLHTISNTFTATGLKKLLLNVYANHNPSSASDRYANRISGGRIYIRESGSSDDWSLLMDISIKDGARSSLLGDYNQWVQDSSTAGSSGDHHFRITIPTNTTLANRGTTYWQLELEAPNLDTYASLNGFSQSTKQISFGQLGASYSTAVIANRRAFVANVKYDEGGSGSNDGLTEFSSFGDRIMFSEIGKYDTFPNLNFIEASKGDAENYVKIESFADRILAYKQRTMQVVNVSSSSPASWYIEDTVYSAGVKYPYSVCKGELGVVWANSNGVYYYNGSDTRRVNDGKISDEEWASFGGQQLSLGYISDSNQVMIIQDVDQARHGYIYDIRTGSFTYAKDLAPNAFNDSVTNGSSFIPVLTNFINDSSGRLITAYDVKSTDLAGEGNNVVIFTPYDISAKTHKTYKVETGDYDLGTPSLVKKFYKLYIHYQHSASTVVPAANVYYQINQSGTWVAFSTGSLTQADGVYKTAVFAPSSPVQCQSIAFKIDIAEGTNGWDTESKIYINDMQAQYRIIGNKDAVAG